LLLGASSAVSEPKHPDALVAAASDAPTAADAPLSEPISIDRLTGSVDLKSDVEVPSLEASRPRTSGKTASPSRRHQAKRVVHERRRIALGVVRDRS